MGTARALAVAVLLLCGYQAALSLIQIDPSTRQFVDEQGRVRIYHGVNAVYKIPPWQPITTHFDPQNSISAEDIQNLTEWGFNVVRLGVMWPGVMPSVILPFQCKCARLYYFFAFSNVVILYSLCCRNTNQTLLISTT